MMPAAQRCFSQRAILFSSFSPSAGGLGLLSSLLLALCLVAAPAAVCGQGSARLELAQRQRSGDSNGRAASAVKPSLTLARTPLAFEPNRGQDKSSARFVAHGPGYFLRLEDQKAVMELHDPADHPNDGAAAHSPSKKSTARSLSMSFVNATGRPAIAGESQLKATASYFAGSDPKGWIKGVPAYARVSYKGVYTGIDLSFYGKDSRLEYDFLLRPKADAAKIQFALEGADDARLDGSGNLILDVGGREVRFLKPVAYQTAKPGAKQESVAVDYRLSRRRVNGKVLVGFILGNYDHARELVIDPVLDYGTYLLASDSYVTGIAADASGNTYVLTEEASDASYTYPGFTVLKFDPNGNLLLSGTVSAANGSDAVPTAIAVSSTGSVYVAGYAGSGLPTTANAYQASNPNNDPNYYFNAFIAVLQPNGSTTAPALVPSYISYLGGTYGQTGSGNDFTYAVAADAQGDAYIAGITGGETFPTTTGAYETAYPSGATSAGFVAKFDPTKTGAASLIYSTLLA